MIRKPPEQNPRKKIPPDKEQVTPEKLAHRTLQEERGGKRDPREVIEGTQIEEITEIAGNRI